jgi:hypothetical protein
MSRAPRPRESPANLRIQFHDGERPHVFWVSDWTKPPDPPARYKVLSKRRANGSIEVIVIEESEERGRQCLAREDIPADAPAGWLSRWVSELAGSIGVSFERFDLRSIETEGEWRETAERLGWTLEPREEGEKSL